MTAHPLESNQFGYHLVASSADPSKSSQNATVMSDGRRLGRVGVEQLAAATVALVGDGAQYANSASAATSRRKRRILLKSLPLVRVDSDGRYSAAFEPPGTPEGSPGPDLG